MDPEIYLRTVVNLLMEYPESVVKTVAKQLPRKVKWLPAVAEIAEACEAEAKRCWEAVKRDELFQRQQRPRIEPPPRPKRTPEEVQTEWMRMECVYGAPLRKPGEHGRPMRDWWTDNREKWDKPGGYRVECALVNGVKQPINHPAMQPRDPSAPQPPIPPERRDREVRNLMGASGMTREQVETALDGMKDAPPDADLGPGWKKVNYTLG
jgi:hypothetical protein